jgi:hypothetical protein
MNTRFLTLLTTLAFLGFSISAIAGKSDKCKPWPSCNIASSDGEELYNVEITINGVDGSGGGGTYWQYDGKGVDYTRFQLDGDGKLNLDYFRSYLDGGTNCFGNESGTVSLYAGGLRTFKHGTARGGFWFDGKATDGATDVRYLLWVTGQFDDPKTWPEEVANKVNRAHLRNWSIEAEGGPETVENSCQGGETRTGDVVDFMTVDVFATSLQP